MEFKSKIDWWFHLVVIAMTAFMIWLCLHGILERDLFAGAIGIVFIMINALLIFPIWLNTGYFLDESYLSIKCGLSKPLRIPYVNISDIKNTRNILGASALSLDRLEIKFGDRKVNDVVFISPQNKDEFMQRLYQKMK